MSGIQYPVDKKHWQIWTLNNISVNVYEYKDKKNLPIFVLLLWPLQDIMEI